MAPERLKGSAREGFGRTAIAYVVLLVALVLTVLAFYYVGRNVEAREQERFEEITSSAERAVDRRMQTYIDAMLDGRGLFAASESVTRRSGPPTSRAATLNVATLAYRQ
jgi:CHASE1-domain containing sensor protein